MSTIQKAFIFIVVVLAILTAAVNLVLFAQRTNWRDQYTKQSTTLKDTQSKLDTALKALTAANEAAAAKIGELENELAAANTELTARTSELESTRADKGQMEALVSGLTAKYADLSGNFDALSTRLQELQAAKDADDAKMETLKLAAMKAEEDFAMADRKAKDLTIQVAGLTDQLAAGKNQIDMLAKKIAVFEANYGPTAGPSTVPTSIKPVYGRVTRLSSDGATAFASVGADDGVVDGMLLLIYKADGTYVATAKVYEVAARQSAARILQPLLGSIVEGDNVTNK